MTDDTVHETRRGNWESLPEPFRQLKYADLVRRLANTLDQDQLPQALALASSFCSTAARWAETQPSTSLASYRTALLVADPHAAWQLAGFLDSEQMSGTDMAIAALIAVRWLEVAVSSNLSPSSRAWRVASQALFSLLAESQSETAVVH